MPSEAPADRPKFAKAGFGAITAEKVAEWISQGRPLGGAGNTKFIGSMSRQEVQVRLDEASKMVSPENQKFLPPDLQTRTGLELNPLWMMECLVRSGSLNPGQMVGALKTLSEYTHSKAPNLSQSLVAHAKAEDFLLQLAETQYPPVVIEQAPKRAAPGSGKNAEAEKAKRERYKAKGWIDDKGAYIPKRLRDGRETPSDPPPSTD